MECSALPAGGDDCCTYPDGTKLQAFEYEGVKWCVGDCEVQVQ